jgi:hypothetical protein
LSCGEAKTLTRKCLSRYVQCTSNVFDASVPCVILPVTGTVCIDSLWCRFSGPAARCRNHLDQQPPLCCWGKNWS